jgi:cytochrome c oxidase subunit 2
MRRPRPRALSLLALLGGALLVVLATPAAAQSVNREVIDELHTQLLYVALPLTLFVELTLVYALYRFRDNDDPEPTVDDRALEITWTVATAVILVFVGVSAYSVMANPYVTPTPADAADADADDLVIEVLAYQWGWQFTYPNGVTTRDRLVLPADADVRLVMESTDVVHSLYVPALGLKQDVVPGQRRVARTRATAPGEYDLFCAELCGAGHSRMDGTIRVLDRTAYDAWLATRSAGGVGNASIRPPRSLASE